jgi:hypothetical protein
LSAILPISTKQTTTSQLKPRNQVIKIYNFIFRSSATFYLFGGNKNVYVCIKFEQQTVTNSDAYYFYFGSGMFYMLTITDIGFGIISFK